MPNFVMRGLKQGLLFAAQIMPIFRFGKKELRVLMYHGVDDIYFSKTAFQSQISFLTQHFELFFVSEIPHLLENGLLTHSGKPPLVLTFDDGLKNNETIVAPILDYYGAKATFYLVSGLLQGGQMLWNHELFCRLLVLSDEDIRLHIESSFVSGHNKGLAVRVYIEKVKAWPHEERRALLEKIKQVFPHQVFSEDLKKTYEIMSIEDAKKLPSCIEIGSHTVTHPILNTVTREKVVEEVRASKEQLERLLNRPILSFCYPNGIFTEEAVLEVKKHYKLAVTTQEGTVSVGDDLFRLKRISSRVNLSDLVAQLLFSR
jgi:peptidoglycan/xylan/chitin deacetylase (PgdA/CDA1 family)